jgi:archaeal flagellar protein FlaJ
MNDSQEIKRDINYEKRAIKEMQNLLLELRNSETPDERSVISSQIKDLKDYIKKANKKLGDDLKGLSLIQPLKKEIKIPEKSKYISNKNIVLHKTLLNKNFSDFKLSDLEKITLKRLKRKKTEKKKKLKIRKANPYIKFSNKVFSKISTDLEKEAFFKSMRRDLIKSNLEILPRSYISILLMTSLISVFVAIFVILFFLFFNFGAEIPFITRSSEAIGTRIVKIFWVLFVIPLITFITLYFYPNLEKKSDEAKINQELPFAAIHMSAVSGSLVDPTKIFSILISTGDYPNISKQFTKLLNQINMQGRSLANSLRIISFNGPSEKLGELLNGLSTTITSGGDLQVFFEKRAESLMLDYKLSKEKYAKTAETFMDIYISVVIAAPMILMLLLIMMKISGLGVGFSAGAISLIMSLGVGIINFAFLVFLHLRSATMGE